MTIDIYVPGRRHSERNAVLLINLKRRDHFPDTGQSVIITT
jgi:hypothetical protein